MVIGMAPHRDYEDLKRHTVLRPDLSQYWFEFKSLYPGSYVVANELEDRGQSYLLIDGAFYHSNDRTKSVFHRFLVEKNIVEQLNEPPKI